MSTAALPSGLHDRAYDVVARRLKEKPGLQVALGTLGDAVAVVLMIDLEETFGVLIDVDEILPDGTVGDLVNLAASRALPSPSPQVVDLISLAEWKRDRTQRSGEPVIPANDAVQIAKVEAGPSPITDAEVDHAWRSMGLFALISLFAGMSAAVVYSFVAGWWSL